ncbi:hypothetical protein N0V88_006696 [Collariella sp. IMI 366227]|nr:hypothetical protein N0V88_006696 [Collariella sp. IMI 366227]
MEQGHKKSHQHQHPHHPHHMKPSQEPGYTDLAAEECHDLIDRAEEDAHITLSRCTWRTKKKKGGLEGTSSTTGGGSATQKMKKTGENISSTVGDKMGEMKKKMGMEK